MTCKDWVPVSGSARSMVPVAGYFVNRAGDGATAERLMAAFREVYREQVERVLDEGGALLDASIGPARLNTSGEDLRVSA